MLLARCRCGIPDIEPVVSSSKSHNTMEFTADSDTLAATVSPDAWRHGLPGGNSGEDTRQATQ